MSLIPQLKYTDEGVIAPTIQELQDGLWAVMEKAFGSNLNKQYSTPQGQMVTSLAAEFSEMNNNLINLMNLVDPRFSYGVMQEGVGEIYFLKRKQATRSLVQLTFKGLSGIVIPKGFLVSDINNNQWRTTESKFIAANGNITINAESVGVGAISADDNSITTILNSQNGIDSVTNNAPAVMGRDVESREEFEERRKESVATNGKNTNANVYGAVSDLDNVIDCCVVHNVTDETIEVGVTNYPVIRNSLAVSVAGGDDMEIAKTILAKGGSGCSFNGETVITYEDYENFPDFPPSYEIKLIRPAHIPIYFTVEVENISAIGYDQEQYIKNNILSAFNEGKLKARIGRKLVANRYMCRISNVENNVIMGIYIGKTKSEKVNVIGFGIDQFPVLSELNIVIVGAE